ncbi:MAG: exodeoxyribonuclease VII small subunit [Planctomycetes bacterium]|nr:exodeoxyribonuclease VII small subunit [Planctomycetota bacterium]
MTDKKKKAGDEPGYAAASAELEAILQEIESGGIDLDVLSEKVERAALLLDVCRSKLAATETKVQKVTAELTAAAEAEAAAPRRARAPKDEDEDA